ncbi:GlxA family transcriptional regulator [Cellulomonas cellasea]|uniref:Transcriptional regulator GlxA family with amidase domain n=1 Tax=Cellulomonas cellasea TaxID=43670 RepID=A0A7W4UIH8_9CELL|nr:helix-turn-helix domain-containing protein [Cellulomonas cellasea]MBB2924793.1 transcriptional regulator GlxA family with amidase domain [Cellulomonas cellasea]
MPHDVAVLAFEGISPFHLAVPSTVLGNEALAARGLGYRVRVAAQHPGTLTTSAGYDLTVRHGLELLAEAETVVVPSWTRGTPPDAGLVAALRAAHARGARLVGLCLGSFAIAATGLVDGREVATHWEAADELAHAHPAVRVRSDALWCDLGDVVTSAGVAAALDTCLHLVRTDHGALVASAVARALVLAPHRSGSQAQFIEAPVPAAPGDDPLGAAMSWALARLGNGDVDLDAWARAATMSRRTFTRRFRERTGTSPQQWLLDQRLDRARVLLEATDDTVERVAERCGFGGGASLRQHFRARFGVSPRGHRAAFRPVGSVSVA